MNPLAKLSELTDALEFESVDRRSYWRSETGTDLKLRVTPHSEGMPDRVVWLQC